MPEPICPAPTTRTRRILAGASGISLEVADALLKLSKMSAMAAIVRGRRPETRLTLGLRCRQQVVTSHAIQRNRTGVCPRSSSSLEPVAFTDSPGLVLRRRDVGYTDSLRR